MIPNGRLWCGGLLIGSAASHMKPEGVSFELAVVGMIAGIAITAWAMLWPDEAS